MMKKILIIEDDPVLREITAKFIQGENFEVFVAANGLEGVQQTLQHLPDLILCDISMPYMNGLDFYTTIKQIKATATIPLVFFSASIENEDIRAGMRLGADDYIIKPFDFNELLKVIQTRLVKHEKIVQFGDEKFQAAIKHPTLGMFIYQNDRFLYYNETLATIFGYTSEAFSTVTFRDLIQDNKTTKITILNEIDRCLKDINSSVSLKFFANHHTNSKIKVELSGTVLTYKGVPSIVGNIISLNNNQKFNIVNATAYIDFKLSKRELEVLELICAGKSTQQIAELLFLSQRTIETYRAQLLSKTSSKNSAELIMFAIKNKLVSINQ
jgi:PAS domain S-box-containing protein